MKTNVRKLFTAWDFEKEEAWINEMATNGKALVNYSIFTYTFEDCAPGEYIYRLELLERSIKHSKSQDYLQFMEENNIELVTSYANWSYFRKKRIDGEQFVIYSDAESRIKHYKKINTTMVALGISNIALAIPNLLAVIIKNHGSNGHGNYYLGIINLIIGMILIIGSNSMRQSIKRLKKEMKITE